MPLIKGDEPENVSRKRKKEAKRERREQLQSGRPRAPHSDTVEKNIPIPSVTGQVDLFNEFLDETVGNIYETHSGKAGQELSDELTFEYFPAENSGQASEDTAEIPVLPVAFEANEPEAAIEASEKSSELVSVLSAFGSGITNMLSAFGEQNLRFWRTVLTGLAGILRVPFTYFVFYTKALLVIIDHLAFKSVHTVFDELVRLKSELRSFGKRMRQAKGFGKKTAMFFKSCGKGISCHRMLFKSAFNYALPVLAIFAFVSTVNYWNSVTFALQVTYNDKNIGYVEDEAVFIEAENLARERLDVGYVATASSQVISKPSYEVALVSLNKLNDSVTICDRLIENSDSNITNACGIYIDDEFICAVKNETDAKNVFDNLLEPYKTNESDTFVDFIENIEYVQGLYPESEEYMWDAAQLSDALENGKKKEASYYTCEEDDDIYGVAVKNGLTESELLRMNPQIVKYIHGGDKLVVSEEVNMVRVKKMKTVKETVDVAFTTEYTNDSSRFKGDNVTVKDGVPGKEVVTKLITYVNGSVVSSEEIARERTQEPAAKQIKVGTKSTQFKTTTSSGSTTTYNVKVSTGGFIWPAPRATRVSSPYGPRNGGWHGGIDLAGGSVSGTPVVAAKAGTVELVQRSSRGYGHQVLINHGNGIKTRYAHCQAGSISVSVGDYVTAGKQIARVGSTGNSTGPHLHFEVIINGNKVNPYPYIK